MNFEKQIPYNMGSASFLRLILKYLTKTKGYTKLSDKYNRRKQIQKKGGALSQQESNEFTEWYFR